MAYTAITSGHVDADSPLDTTIMGTVKDNFINHESRLVTGEAGGFGVADGAITPAKLSAHTAGDYIICLNADERTTTSSTPVKIKEVKIGSGGTYRIKYTGKDDAYDAGQRLRIYRNGSAVGTDQAPTPSYVEYSEDIAGWATGDLVQIYGTGMAGVVSVKDLKICVAAPHIVGGTNGY